MKIMRNDDATKMNSRVTYRNYGRKYPIDENYAGNIFSKRRTQT
jgi:hypothetical protein